MKRTIHTCGRPRAKVVAHTQLQMHRTKEVLPLSAQWRRSGRRRQRWPHGVRLEVCKAVSVPLPSQVKLGPGGGGASHSGGDPTWLPRGRGRRARSSPVLLQLVLPVHRRQLLVRRLERPAAGVELRERLEAARRLLSRHVAPVRGLVGLCSGGPRAASGSAGRPLLLRSELAAQQPVLDARARVLLLLRVVDLPPIQSEHPRPSWTPSRRRRERISQGRRVAPRCSASRPCCERSQARGNGRPG